MNKSVLYNHFTKPVLNAMKHLMFGCYAVSQCSVSCIISFSIFGHLRFAAVFEGLRQCYKNVLPSHLPFSSVSLKKKITFVSLPVEQDVDHYVNAKQCDSGL